MKSKNTKKPDLKSVKKDDPEQSQRFVETAKEHEAEESGKSFYRAFKDISGSKKNSG